MALGLCIRKRMLSPSVAGIVSKVAWTDPRTKHLLSRRLSIHFKSILCLWERRANILGSFRTAASVLQHNGLQHFCRCWEQCFAARLAPWAFSGVPKKAACRTSQGARAVCQRETCCPCWQAAFQLLCLPWKGLSPACGKQHVEAAPCQIFKFAFKEKYLTNLWCVVFISGCWQCPHPVFGFATCCQLSSKEQELEVKVWL